MSVQFRSQPAARSASSWESSRCERVEIRAYPYLAIVATIARQLGIDDPGALAAYCGMPVRWRHAAEIRDRCGYRDFAAQPGRFAFTAWLYRQA